MYTAQLALYGHSPSPKVVSGGLLYIAPVQIKNAIYGVSRSPIEKFKKFNRLNIFYVVSTWWRGDSND